MIQGQSTEEEEEEEEVKAEAYKKLLRSTVGCSKWIHISCH